MDLSFDDDQTALAELAATILADRCPPEVLRALEGTDDRFAADAWAALARADLLGIGLPDEDGGAGLGLVDAALVAEQVGRHVALVPLWASTAAALAVASWGSTALRRRLLPGAVDGTGPLSVALWEPGGIGVTTRPSTTAVADGDGGWRLDGTLSPVPWARHARAVLVPAAVGEHDVVLVALDPTSPGVTVVDERSVSLEPFASLTLDGVTIAADDVVAGGAPGAGPDALAWLGRRTVALLCATALGVAEGALALTATYVSQREQFGSPIGTFQAVAHRSADSYVDTEAIRLTTWQAAWRLDADLPADDELAVAAFWVAEGGQRVVHAAQHLHGGIGVDVDYPLHRYFRWAKVIELLVGGVTGSLLRLGSSLAAHDPVAP